MDWVASMAHTAEQQQGGNSIDIGSVRLSEVRKPCDSIKQQPSKETPSNLIPPPPPHVTPRYWDLSYVACGDPYGDSIPGCQYLSRLSYLAAQYEGVLYYCSTADDHKTNYNRYWADYQTLQHRLYFMFGRIFQQFPPASRGAPNADLRSALDSLYRETIQQLQKLMDRASGASNRSTGEPTTGAPNAESSPSNGSVPSAVSTNTSQSVPKKDMALYLTDWLRENWTNPYPDEDGVAELAQTCGTTPTVISNWLINARTRKWRPAIVKAAELDRPADFLLEDSMNLFDGKPVRPLEDCDEDEFLTEGWAAPLGGKKRHRS